MNLTQRVARVEVCTATMEMDLQAAYSAVQTAMAILEATHPARVELAGAEFRIEEALKDARRVREVFDD